MDIHNSEQKRQSPPRTDQRKIKALFYKRTKAIINSHDVFEPFRDSGLLELLKYKQKGATTAYYKDKYYQLTGILKDARNKDLDLELKSEDTDWKDKFYPEEEKLRLEEEEETGQIVPRVHKIFAVETDKVITRLNTFLETAVDKAEIEIDVPLKHKLLFIEALLRDIKFHDVEEGKIIRVEIVKSGRTSEGVCLSPFFISEFLLSFNFDFGKEIEYYNPQISMFELAEKLIFSVINKRSQKDLKNRRGGAYFTYHHKLPINLERYQIYKNSFKNDWDFKKKKRKSNFPSNKKNYDDGKINCFISCLIKSKFDNNVIQKAKEYIKKGQITKNNLNKFAKEAGITIILTEDRPNKINQKNKQNILKYNVGQEKILNIGLVQNHYFPNDLECCGGITAFAVKNYNKIKQEKNWQKISKAVVKKGKVRFERLSKAKKISSFTLIRLLAKYKDELLENIPNKELLQYSQENYKNREILPEKSKTNKVVYSEKNREYSSYSVFDVETTTTGRHKVYCASLAIFDKNGIEPIRTITRNIHELSDLTKLFEFLPPNKKVTKIGKNGKEYTKVLSHQVYAHNSKYDYSSLKEIMTNKKQCIESGGRLLSITGMIGRKKIQFKDSKAIINKPLSEFGRMFKIESEKDVMAYGLYTQASIKRESMRIETVVQYFLLRNEKDKAQKFLSNIAVLDRKYPNFLSVNKKLFDHLRYARYYCEKDVITTAQGLIKFNLMLVEETGLELFQYLSICSISHDSFIKDGCYEDTYELTSITRDYIRKSLVGGRCMLSNNKPKNIQIKSDYRYRKDLPEKDEDELIQDFDAVSLYPTAMKRIGILGGYLKGEPKILSEELLNYNFLLAQDGYFITIKLKKDYKKRNFPLLSVINSKTKTRDWVNNIKGTHSVNKFDLEDLIEFGGLNPHTDIDILHGYYYNEGRNPLIKSVIQKIFDKRKELKAADNPAQAIFKLLMNSDYGKQGQKAIRFKYIFADTKEARDRIICTNHNIYVCDYPLDNGSYKIKLFKDTFNHKSLVHLASEVLSMSKRIMSEVMCLAEDNEIPIYYQDTDSIHLSNKNVKKLEKLFKKKYERDLIGSDMGQFHCDFEDLKITKEIAKKNKLPKKTIGKKYKAIGSKAFIGIRKKVYYDEVLYDCDGILVTHQHYRMKGISNSVVEGFAKDKSEGAIGIRGIYDLLIAGETIFFDFVKYKDTNFRYYGDGTVHTITKFTRKVNRKEGAVTTIKIGGNLGKQLDTEKEAREENCYGEYGINVSIFE